MLTVNVLASSDGQVQTRDPSELPKASGELS